MRRNGNLAAWPAVVEVEAVKLPPIIDVLQPFFSVGPHL